MEVCASLAVVLDFDIDHNSSRRYLWIALSSIESFADVRLHRIFFDRVILRYGRFAA